MIPSSLRARFTILAAGAITVALVLAGFVLTFIFDGNIRARAVAEVGDDLRTLAAHARIAADGRLVIDVELSDPRFRTPYGGYYWQAGRGQAAELKSRSLLDFAIDWRPQPPTGNDVAIYERPAPEGRRMFVLERRVVVPGGSTPTIARIAVGLDQGELDEARTAFIQFAASSLAALGLALVAALWFATRASLAPLRALRAALIEVHHGRRTTVEGAFPDEVRPLVDDLNALLQARNADLVTARARAGDLAHGLKTPLAVLSSTARHLRETGQMDAATEIDGEIQRMSRHVTRELVRARAGVRAFRRSHPTPVAPVAAALTKALAVLPSTHPIAFEVKVPASAAAPMDETDLTEVLGNVIDNARKWTRGRVQIAAEEVAGGGIRITVEDDGPGLPDDDPSFEIERGRRLDEQVEGSGFGLAIVKDLVEAYGGDLTLGRSALGGLKVDIALP
ncbi:ATP-binding protein [Phreatobacter stygius]|uniref:histidine kinase n=1 Tax=Phreatobacter stygius TaxID=1940610 RepID=A0A4D7B0H9_9HYPH|nr:HAMP domain-containing sensor histidine kinase [Phreatobacter stygius]QCI65005.1 HAMP domain-containing histidine kinase [Phreatobacter stygius]